MEFDSGLIVEYLQPYLLVLCGGFCLATLVFLLAFGIHKALMLLNV